MNEEVTFSLNDDLPTVESAVNIFYTCQGTPEWLQAHEYLINFFEGRVSPEKIDLFIQIVQTTREPKVQNLCWISLCHALEKHWTILRDTQRLQMLECPLGFIQTANIFALTPSDHLLLRNASYLFALAVKHFYKEDQRVRNFLGLVTPFFQSGKPSPILLGLKLLTNVVDVMKEENYQPNSNEASITPSKIGGSLQPKFINNKTKIDFRNFTLTRLLEIAFEVYKFWLKEASPSTPEFEMGLSECLMLFHSLFVFNQKETDDLADSAVSLPAKLLMAVETELWTIVKKAEVLETFFDIFETYAMRENGLDMAVLSLSIIRSLLSMTMASSGGDPNSEIYIGIIFTRLQRVALSREVHLNLKRELLEEFTHIIADSSQIASLQVLLNYSVFQEWLVLASLFLIELASKMSVELLPLLNYHSTFWEKIAPAIHEPIFIKSELYERVSVNLDKATEILGECIKLYIQGIAASTDPNPQWFDSTIETLSSFSSAIASVSMSRFISSLQRVYVELIATESCNPVPVLSLCPNVLQLAALLEVSWGSVFSVKGSITIESPGEATGAMVQEAHRSKPALELCAKALGSAFRMLLSAPTVEGTISIILQFSYARLLNIYFSKYFIALRVERLELMHQLICNEVRAETPSHLLELFGQVLTLITRSLPVSVIKILLKTMVAVVEQATIGLLPPSYQEFVRIGTHPVKLELLSSWFLAHSENGNISLPLNFQHKFELYQALGRIISMFSSLPGSEMVLDNFLRGFFVPMQRASNLFELLPHIVNLCGILTSFSLPKSFQRILDFEQEILLLEIILKALEMAPDLPPTDPSIKWVLRFLTELFTDHGKRSAAMKGSNIPLFHSTANIILHIMQHKIPFSAFHQMTPDQKVTTIYKPVARVFRAVTPIIQSPLVGTTILKDLNDKQFTDLMTNVFGALGLLKVEDILAVPALSLAYVDLFSMLNQVNPEMLVMLREDAYKRFLVSLRELLKSFDVRTTIQVHNILRSLASHLVKISTGKVRETPDSRQLNQLTLLNTDIIDQIISNTFLSIMQGDIANVSSVAESLAQLMLIRRESSVDVLNTLPGFYGEELSEKLAGALSKLMPPNQISGSSVASALKQIINIIFNQ